MHRSNSQETSDSFGFYAGATAAESGAAWKVAGQLLAEAKARTSFSIFGMIQPSTL